MTRSLWLVGIVLAVLSALAMVVLPVETAVFPALVGLLVGLGLFFADSFMRVRRHRPRVRETMKEFAESNNYTFQESVPAEELPASIPLFQRSHRRRCSNMIRLEVNGHAGFLFTFEYYQRRRRNRGVWVNMQVVLLPGAAAGLPDFELRPEGMLEKVACLLGGQDIEFPQTPAGEEFSRLYRLQGKEVDSIRRLFVEQRRIYFADHPGLHVVCNRDDFAMWFEHRTLDRLKVEWGRSFIPARKWIQEELVELLDAARQLVPVKA